MPRRSTDTHTHTHTLSLTLTHHVQVRHYAKKELSGFIRISVGKPEQTDAVMAALRSMQ
jgi:histidinol-phosphate aminotransferase